MSVVREDVVKVTYDVDDKELSKVDSGIGRLVSGAGKLTSGLKWAASQAGGLAVSLGKTAAKTMAAGVTATASAVSAIGVNAIKSYAEYEQLVGGIDTLFKDSNKEVMKYANNAYKTAGISANQYMDTVTSFSAAMISSVGGNTAEAAKLSNMAVQDMADNANKMGTSMDSIIQTYQSLSRGNYAMLDNLKLGYGGTKEELNRLLADAEKLTGKKFDVSNFADVTEAIHAIQTEMGITGTTAKEAASTIQGSASMMKAAWSNFVTGMADENQNADVLIQNLVDSVMTFGNNIIPRIQTMLPRLASGMTQLVTSLAPKIIQAFSSMVPVLATEAVNLFSGLVGAIQQNSGMIAQGAVQLVNALITGFLSLAPQLILVGVQLIIQFVTGLAQQLPALITFAIQAIATLAQGLIANLPAIIAAAITLFMGLVNGLMSNLPLIIQTGVDLIVALINGAVQCIPMIIGMIPQIFSAFVQGIMSVDWLQVGWDIIKAIVGGIWEGSKSLVKSTWDGIKSLFSDGGSKAGAAADTGLASGMTTNAYTVNSAATGVATGALNNLGTVGNTYSFGTQANSNLASGITAGSYMPTTAASMLGTTTSGAMATATNTAQYGAQAASNLAGGITGNSGTAVSAAASMSSQVEAAASSDVTVKVIGDTSSMSALSAQIGDLVSSATTQLQMIPEAFTQIMAKFVQVGTQGMQQAVNVVKTGMNMIKTTVASTNLYSSGVAVMQGLNRGMQSMLPALIATATQAANAIRNATNAALDIHSPSRVMFESGVNTGLGQIKGLRSTIPDMQIAARDVSSASIPYDSYSPDSASGSYYHGGSSDYTNISPVFNLTISGSQDDRATARKVKRYVAEAISETLESLERKSYSLREA